MCSISDVGVDVGIDPEGAAVVPEEQGAGLHGRAGLRAAGEGDGGQQDVHQPRPRSPAPPRRGARGTPPTTELAFC